MASYLPAAVVAMFALNARIGKLIAYATLAAVGLAVLYRFPLFYKHRLLHPRSRSQGYILRNRSLSKSNHPQFKPHLLSFGSAPYRFFTRFFQFQVPFTGGLVAGQLILMIFYMIALVVLSLYKNTNPTTSISNFRRFGYIALAQLPLTLILAMKNGPLTWLIGQGYEKLNFLHRFTGRMLFVFSVVHGALQVRMQLTTKKAIRLHGASLYGFIALCALSIVALTSLRIIRNQMYQVFLVAHIAGYLTVLVALWQHTPATHPYIAVGVAAVVVDNFLKLLKTRVKRATFTAMPGGLTRIEVAGLKDGWRAGQHVFIRVLTGRHIFEKHPFTIANAPYSSTPHGSTDHLLLVVKAAGDFTKSIHRLAGQPQLSDSKMSVTGKEKIGHTDTSIETQNKISSSNTSFQVLLDGPYGTSFNDMTQYRTVLLSAGGSGFTYCMATLEDIVGEAVQGGRNITKHVILVWALRDLGMVESFAPALEHTIAIGQAHGIEVTVKLFITARAEFDPHQNILPNTLVEFNATRPDLIQIVNKIIDNRPGGGLGVGVCGPSGLVGEMKDTVRRLHAWRIERIGGVTLHCEKFGW